MYYITLILLLFLCLVEIHTRKPNQYGFYVAYLLMTAIATFRYGQLGDYFAYAYLYHHPEAIAAKDPGFALLIMFFSETLGIEYIPFVSTMSFLCMALAFPFFAKSCKGSAIALLFFYAYTFIQGPMSAYRQGLCTSLLLCMYPLLCEKKYVPYYTIVLLGCTIHMSFIIAIIIPFVIKFKHFNEPYVVVVIMAFIVLATFQIDYTRYLPSFLQDRTGGYFEVDKNHEILLQMILRTLIVIPLLLYRPAVNSDAYRAKAMCITGFIMYCFLSGSVLTGGRLEYFFRTFLCLFVASVLITGKRKSMMSGLVLTYLITIHTFMWFKNIDFARTNGGYRAHVSWYNFPYVSVFNKEELWQYSPIESYSIYLE